MRAGESGRIAIFWDQTEIDGLEAAPLSYLSVGAAWSWRGQARFLVDSLSQERQQTGGSQEQAAKPVGFAVSSLDQTDGAAGILVVTNGAQQFRAILISVMGESGPALVFEGEYPVRDQEFWISERIEIERQGGATAPADDTVIAFPPRTRAEDGLEPVDRRSVATAGRRAD